MKPISEEEIRDTSDISPEIKREFIEHVITTFETFYTVNDVEEQIKMMRSFGDDATAVMNFAYGALLTAHMDIVEFIDAVKSLAAQSDEE